MLLHYKEGCEKQRHESCRGWDVQTARAAPVALGDLEHIGAGDVGDLHVEVVGCSEDYRDISRTAL